MTSHMHADSMSTLHISASMFMAVRPLGAIHTRGTFHLHSTGSFPKMPVECGRAFG